MNKRLICALLAAVLLLGVVAIGPLPARAESNMYISDQGIAMIKAFEGFADKPYWDNSQYSVGWGCRIDINKWNSDSSLKNADGTIKLSVAEDLLKNALDSFCAQVNAFANDNGLTLTQGQFDALTSLSFNIGGAWMKKTGGVLFQAVTGGAAGDCLAYAFTLYSTSAGIPTQGHLLRRLLELQMYLYDIYDTSRSWPQTLRYVLLDGNGGSVRYVPHGFSTEHPTSEFRTALTAPTGTDEAGNPFTYEFAGWYTAPSGGEPVTQLDASLENGRILYAQWKDPATGQTVDLRPGEAVDVKVKATGNVTLREGPGAFYQAIRTASKGELLHITRTTTGMDGKVWGLTAEGWVCLEYTNYGTSGSSGSTGTTLTPGTWATVTASNVRIRTGPGTGYADTGAYMELGKTYAILDIQEEEGAERTWGQIGEDQWFCLKNNGADYATIQVITEETPEEDTQISAPDISGAITVSSVEIADLPTKTQYTLCGQERTPDPTGGRVKVTYSDGTKKWITMTRGMISGFDNTVMGENTLMVTVGGKTATFTVRIVPVDVESIAMKQLPDKVHYIKDTEALDLKGASILVQYSPYGTEILPVTEDMVTGFDNSVLGPQVLTVTYQEFTAEFSVDVVSNDLQGISVASSPTKRKYLKDTDALDLTGLEVLASYSYTGEKTLTVTEDMVTGFDNTKAGKQTLTVTYHGFAATFEIEIVLPKVVFKNYDGTVLSSAYYDFGEEVIPPETPTKPADAHGEYKFTGWDKEVVACQGNATYTAQFELAYPKGDVDRNMVVDEDDAIYLLRHVVFPDKYPVAVTGDYDDDGDVDGDDAIYLLRHVIFPDKYPLS